MRYEFDPSRVPAGHLSAAVDEYDSVITLYDDSFDFGAINGLLKGGRAVITDRLETNIDQGFTQSTYIRAD